MENLVEKLKKIYGTLDEIRDKEKELIMGFRELGVEHFRDEIPRSLENMEIRIINECYEFAKENFERVGLMLSDDKYFYDNNSIIKFFDKNTLNYRKISSFKVVHINDIGILDEYIKLKQRVEFYSVAVPMSLISIIGIPLIIPFAINYYKNNKKLKDLKEGQKISLGKSLSQRETILYLLENYPIIKEDK